MESFLSTFPPLTSPLCALPAPGGGGGGGGWAKQRDGRFLTPQGLNYLELVKAILSHHGGPVLPARRATTRECGVQVNGKVDKAVQCSLGPKTLQVPTKTLQVPTKTLQFPLPAAAAASPRSPHLVRQQVGGGTPRFLRPVSIYSPAFDRRILLKKPPDGDPSDGEEEEEEAEEAEEEEEEEEEGEADQSGVEKDPKATLHRAYKGSNFQFLEQRYGFFHCKKCNIRWESAYVWCISGTSKVYHKQLCRKCQVGFNPYRVESIVCKGCSQTCCSCKKKERHINMKRPHRQDLCCRCKGMRLSCDSTYSFKYII